MLKYYCGTRSNSICFRVVDGLIRKSEKEKLIALLENKTHGQFPIFTALLQDMVWIPMGDNTLRKIVDIVGLSTLKKIEKAHIKSARGVRHIYRASDKPNQHGYCNSNPYPKHQYTFPGYNFD